MERPLRRLRHLRCRRILRRRRQLVDAIRARLLNRSLGDEPFFLCAGSRRERREFRGFDFLRGGEVLLGAS